MQHWLYFYEHSIGCVGVLKDWLIRAVAAALDDGSNTLTLQRLHEHTLTLAQCERMALDATEGEQKLSYMESRREHLWHLLQIGMDSRDIPKSAVPLETSPVDSPTSVPQKPEPLPKSRQGKKKTNPQKTPQNTDATRAEVPVEPAPKKKQTRTKKTASTTTQEIPPKPLGEESADTKETTDAHSRAFDFNLQEQTPLNSKKKSGKRVGQRKPSRDAVGKSMST